MYNLLSFYFIFFFLVTPSCSATAALSPLSPPLPLLPLPPPPSRVETSAAAKKKQKSSSARETVIGLRPQVYLWGGRRGSPGGWTSSSSSSSSLFRVSLYYSLIAPTKVTLGQDVFFVFFSMGGVTCYWSKAEEQNVPTWRLKTGTLVFCLLVVVVFFNLKR